MTKLNGLIGNTSKTDERIVGKEREEDKKGGKMSLSFGLWKKRRNSF